MKKRAVALLVLFIVTRAGMTQPGAAAITQKFNAYRTTYIKTRLYLIFNQDKFSPGDTAWFKAYFLREDLTGIGGKQKIELNLVDGRGESKLHIIFNVSNGIGENQIAIPETLSPGIYLVTAYSSWMKNFDPPPVFRKEIRVVRKNSVVPVEKPCIQAVAEGGHLIRDIPNKISVRAYPPGSGVQIIDSVTREIVAETNTDNGGVASLIFTPRRHALYLARLEDRTATCLLPPTEEDGCSLLLTPAARGEKVKIRIASPPGSVLRERGVLIVLSAGSGICYAEKCLQGPKEFVERSIDQSDLPGGVIHVSLLGAGSELLASRDFYSPEKDTVLPGIYTSRDSFHTRERVSLGVSLTDAKGQPVEGEFSVSAVNAGLFEEGKKNTFSDELSILSPLKEEFLIDRSDPAWFRRLDNFLICETADLPWKEILSDNLSKPRFGFTGAIEKKGKAFFGDPPVPVPDYTQIMFYLQQGKIHYQTFSLDQGKVRLTLPDLFGQDEFFYLAETKKGTGISDLKIMWDADGMELPSSRPSRETDRPDQYASFMEKTRLINRSYAFYGSGEGNDNREARGATRFEDETGGVDITINVQDYILMSTMDELVKEVIPSLYLRKAGGRNILRVNLPEPLYPATGDPVYIIDGIATHNTAFFLSLKPSDLLTVKIIKDPKKLTPFKLMGKNGIVIVQTRNGDTREPLADTSRLVEGVNRPVAFRAPDFSADNDRHMPDFRSTIYWNPSLKTDSDGKATVDFFCSDDVGRLRIRVDGLAAGGRPFSATLYVRVTAPE